MARSIRYPAERDEVCRAQAISAATDAAAIVESRAPPARSSSHTAASRAACAARSPASAASIASTISSTPSGATPISIEQVYDHRRTNTSKKCQMWANEWI